MEQTLGEEIVNIWMGQQGQFDTLDMRLKQLEATRAGQSSVAGGPLVPTDIGTSTSDSPVPAIESDLSLTAQLAVANPARQNLKLIGQALRRHHQR